MEKTGMETNAEGERMEKKGYEVEGDEGKC